MKAAPRATSRLALRTAPHTDGKDVAGGVVDLDRVRIALALARRRRYRYVRPRVEREGDGWKVVSPNCSRTIDRQGGEIAIAWLVPEGGGRWQLHARHHADGTWRLAAGGLALDEALATLCSDPARRFWP